MRNIDKSNGKMLRNLIIGLIAFVGFTCATFAQERTARPDRGTGGKGTQAASEIDSVSLQNGNVSLSIPLASLPPVAGGKLSASISAYYNSKLYDAHSIEKSRSGGAPGCQSSYTTSEPAISGSGGWKIGGGYVLFMRDAHEDYDYLPASSEQCFGYDFYYMQGRFFKPMLRSPDGSEHELRISGNYPTYSNQGEKDFLKNYYKYMGANPTPAFDTPTTLYSVDGTYMKIIVNPPSNPVQWTAYMKDGTQIIQQSDGQRVKDTNGNSILYGSGFARDEQTGREIRTAGTTVNGQNATQIQYQKVSGGWENMTVVWGTTTVQGKTYKTNAGTQNGSELDCYIDKEYRDDISVIREIILPATEQNTQPQKYTFSYNSDATIQATLTEPRWGCGQTFSPYTRTASYGLGELSQITAPTGAVYKYHYNDDGKHDFGLVGEEGAQEISRNIITSKEIVHDGTTDIWTYGIDTNPSYVTVGSVTNPDGSWYGESFYPVGVSNPAFGGTAGLGGLTYRTKQSGRIMTEKHWTLLGGVLQAYGSGSANLVSYNPVVDTEYTTLLVRITHEVEHRFRSNLNPHFAST